MTKDEVVLESENECTRARDWCKFDSERRLREDVMRTIPSFEICKNILEWSQFDDRFCVIAAPESSEGA